MAETYLCKEKCFFHKKLWHQGETYVADAGEKLPPYFVKQSEADKETLELAEVHPPRDYAAEGESMAQLQKRKLGRAKVGMLAGMPTSESEQAKPVEAAPAQPEKVEPVADAARPSKKILKK